jgi:outer membrane lipoprotein SlyB
MKRILAIVAAGAMLAMAPGAAQASDRGVNGLILGAGGGAILGQAIGRDTEGTLIGSAVGGVLGYIIGNETGQQTIRPVETHAAGTVIIKQGRPCPPDYHFVERRSWREPMTRVVVIERDSTHRHGGPPPGRGWRKERWRGASWR